jgi:putative SOS response-associated peptidase YedK
MEAAMCGRYILAQAARAERAMGIEHGHWDYVRSFRVLPTEQVPVVVQREGKRAALLMRWGLVPWWARGVPLKASTINATLERLQNAPAYRDAWQRGQRCILPMAGFYEPHVNEDGTRDPFFVRLAEREVFGVAGLWERSPRADCSYLSSCTLITVPANTLLVAVHNAKPRMPAILEESAYRSWLCDPPQIAHALLRPYPPDSMQAWKVSRRVNNPGLANDASLIEPV